MTAALTILLAFQLAGEVLARSLALPLPGPVIGMAGLALALALWPRLAGTIDATVGVILAHLSLLFVPAGVGVVGHLDRIGAEGLGLVVALLGSTLLAMLAAAGAFAVVVRLTGQGGADRDEAPP